MKMSRTPRPPIAQEPAATTTGAPSQTYRAPSPEPVQAFAEGELEAAEGDMAEWLQLIIKNAQQGRYGSSKLKDPERLGPAAGPKFAASTPETATASGNAASSTGSSTKQRAPEEVDRGIEGTRSEVDLVTKSSSESSLERLNTTLQLGRELMRHI